MFYMSYIRLMVMVQTTVFFFSWQNENYVQQGLYSIGFLDVLYRFSQFN